MRKTMRLAMTALAAVLALAMLTGSASALRSVDLEPSGPLIRMTLGALTFSYEVLGVGISIICSVMLNTSLHAKAAKARGALLGFVSTGGASGCRDSTGHREPDTRLTLLFPMHVQYDSITGTLPTITGGRIRVAFAFLLRTLGPLSERNGCLYEGLIDLNLRENPFTRLTIERINNSFALRTSLEGICPGRFAWEGTFTSDRRGSVILLE